MSRTGMTRCLAVLALLLSTAVRSITAAEPAKAIDVWPGKPPGETHNIGPEVIQPPKADENPRTTRITNIGRPTLSVFLPSKGKRNGTSVIVCPGGGFHILAWDKEGTEVAEWLNTLGVTA